MFTAEQLPEIQRLITEHTERDFREILEPLIDHAHGMKPGVRTIRPRTATSIALTAADGGNHSVDFNPFSLHLIRVVDSKGRQCLLDAVSPGTDLVELSRKHVNGGEARSPLGRMMLDLGVTTLQQLSPMMKNPDNLSWVQVYRDLCEWATLYELITARDWGQDTLIVRDGLLRSKQFASSGSKGESSLFIDLYGLIKNAIEQKRRSHNIRLWLVGLAKQTNLLNAYRLALAVAEVFEPGEPCYCEVTEQMLEQVYKWSEYYRNPEDISSAGESPRFNMGRMHLVRFGTRSGDPLWTVDLLESQRNEAQTIFGALLKDAIEGFPVPELYS